MKRGGSLFGAVHPKAGSLFHAVFQVMHIAAYRLARSRAGRLSFLSLPAADGAAWTGRSTPRHAGEAESTRKRRFLATARRAAIGRLRSARSA